MKINLRLNWMMIETQTLCNLNGQRDPDPHFSSTLFSRQHVRHLRVDSTAPHFSFVYVSENGSKQKYLVWSFLRSHTVSMNLNCYDSCAQSNARPSKIAFPAREEIFETESWHENWTRGWRLINYRLIMSRCRCQC